MSLPKRARREDADWPSTEEIDRQLLQALFKGKSPFKKWSPCTDIDQAMRVAQDVAWKRGWNFEIKWVSYAGRIVIDEWEARLVNYNEDAARRQDYKNAIEDYWATGKTPALTLCRMLLNFVDGVQENEYNVDGD